MDPSKATVTSFDWINHNVAPIKSIKSLRTQDEARLREFREFIGGYSVSTVAEATDHIKNNKSHPLAYIFPLQQLIHSNLVRLNHPSNIPLEDNLTNDVLDDLRKNLHNASNYRFALERSKGVSVYTSSGGYTAAVIAYLGVQYYVNINNLSDPELKVSVSVCDAPLDRTFPDDLKFTSLRDMLLSLAQHRTNILKSTIVHTPYGDMSQYDYMTQFMGVA